jgi:CTP:molybdopterin cytidylyltransferase MocA
MGRPKPLLPLGDKPVIRHCLDALTTAGISDIVVVVSPSGQHIVELLRGLPAAIAVNKTAGSDMAESVRTGLRGLNGFPSAIMTCLSDHPLVSSETIRAIVRLHHETPDSIIIPCYQGKRGHPTLFSMRTINEIFSGITLRDIIRNHADQVRSPDFEDKGVILDMDTEEDYLMISRTLSKGMDRHPTP